MKILINGNARQFTASSMTITDMLKELNVAGKRIAIERNGEIVPPQSFCRSCD